MTKEFSDSELELIKLAELDEQNKLPFLEQVEKLNEYLNENYYYNIINIDTDLHNFDLEDDDDLDGETIKIFNYNCETNTFMCYQKNQYINDYMVSMMIYIQSIVWKIKGDKNEH